MSLSAIVQALAEAGATPAQLAAAVAAHERAETEKLVEKRAKDAARKRRSRLGIVTRSHAESRGHRVTNGEMSRGHPVTSVDSADTKEKSPHTPLKENTSSLRSEVGAASPAPKKSPRPILETALSPEMAEAVLDHRRKKRAPLTVVAAEGLAKGFLATGDPEAAARMMIERGWQGFKPEWFHKDRRDDVPKPTVHDAAAQLVEFVRGGGTGAPALGGGSRQADVRLLSQGRGG